MSASVFDFNKEDMDRLMRVLQSELSWKKRGKIG